MQIEDHYNEYRTTVYLKVTDIDESVFNGNYGTQIVPLDYVNEKIVSEYEARWNQEDLSVALGIKEYADYKDKHLRSVMSVSFSDTGSITITAIAQTETEAEK